MFLCIIHKMKFLPIAALSIQSCVNIITFNMHTLFDLEIVLFHKTEPLFRARIYCV